MENKGKTKLLDFTPWTTYQSSGNRTTMVDDLGNANYKFRTFKGGMIENHGGEASPLQPGGKVKDVLLFQPEPIKTAKWLHVELPGSVFAGGAVSGNFTLDLPCKNLEIKPEAAGPSSSSAGPAAAPTAATTPRFPPASGYASPVSHGYAAPRGRASARIPMTPRALGWISSHRRAPRGQAVRGYRSPVERNSFRFPVGPAIDGDPESATANTSPKRKRGTEAQARDRGEARDRVESEGTECKRGVLDPEPFAPCPSPARRASVSSLAGASG